PTTTAGPGSPSSTFSSSRARRPRRPHPEGGRRRTLRRGQDPADHPRLAGPLPPIASLSRRERAGGGGALVPRVAQCPVPWELPVPEALEKRDHVAFRLPRQRGA